MVELVKPSVTEVVEQLKELRREASALSDSGSDAIAKKKLMQRFDRLIARYEN